VTITPEGAVVIKRRIKAPPETVFACFLEHDRRLSWQGVEGYFDPRPGGVYRMRVVGDAIAVGAFTKLEPYQRLVFSWGWENEGDPVPPGSSQVRVDLAPDAEGTALTLTHSELPEPARQPHQDGWEHYLARLAVLAEGGDPGPDPWMQEAEEADESD
jgi:uncharacterized protein YndB with AHSA1/START domain